ncbi:MAG TPA: phosphonate C-P lyase system protein PhnH [Ramlibacter sp.]|uniref:phosphonate C-P lyase system protein PhnH n=1 Tax=Ramlibacter sp. TaxID=1917967 RepID=UPI002ED4E9C4
MDAIPAGGLGDPVHDAQQAFRVALEALSRPGRAQALGTPIAGLPLGAAQAHLLLTLTDEDTRVWWQEPSPALQRWLRFHTGARFVADPAQAAFAVVTRPADLPELRRFRGGTAAEPEHSCTLLVEVPSLQGGLSMDAHGPGIPGGVRLAVAGLPEGFWAEWQASHAGFPQGVDIFFTCGAQVLGLPRTTRVGRLQEV